MEIENNNDQESFNIPIEPQIRYACALLKFISKNATQIVQILNEFDNVYILCFCSSEKEKVIDHDYFTGEVRGIAHNNCNIHFHLQKTKIPVIFHNLKGCDGHFIVKQIGDYLKENNLDSKIDVIANNSEKFMLITWKNVRFIDSAQFMNSSLEKLGKNLSVEQKTYTMNYLKHQFGDKLNQQELEQIINKFLTCGLIVFQNQKINNYLRKKNSSMIQLMKKWMMKNIIMQQNYIINQNGYNFIKQLILNYLLMSGLILEIFVKKLMDWNQEIILLHLDSLGMQCQNYKNKIRFNIRS